MPLKNHARSVVQPGFDYFTQKFDVIDGELKHQMLLLKLARLCNPIRLREVCPTPEQLEELNSFKILSNPDSPISIQGLKEELPQFLALAADINAENFGIESILPFFQSHTEEIPIWGRFASVLAAQQMNSAAVERVFSFLKQAFKETQETSLSDYVEAVVIQRYNNRDEFHV